MARPYREADEQRRWIMTWKAIAGGLAFYFLMQLTPLVALLPSYLRLRWDSAENRKLLLEPLPPVDSPDGHLRFVTVQDGPLKVVDTKTGQVQRTASLSPHRYRRLQVRWKDATHIEIEATFRYPFKMKGSAFTWDLQTGKLQECCTD